MLIEWNAVVTPQTKNKEQHQRQKKKKKGRRKKEGAFCYVSRVCVYALETSDAGENGCVREQASGKGDSVWQQQISARFSRKGALVTEKRRELKTPTQLPQGAQMGRLK